jgi:hypothetical protein
MPTTPIAAVAYESRAATGLDDLGLIESRAGGLATAVELAQRRTRGADGQPLEAEALPVGDIDAIVVALRRDVFGERLVATGRCGSCGEPIDIALRMHELSEHRRPRRPRNAVPSQEPGWWSLGDGAVEFRVPTAGDVLAALDASDPRGRLAGVCMRGEVTRRRERAAERALEAIAPTLRTDVEGPCPECNEATALDVDTRELCLQDLRFAAGAVLEETHLLASEYQWSERAILELPSVRRAKYAEWVRASRGSPVGAEAFGA